MDLPSEVVSLLEEIKQKLSNPYRDAIRTQFQFQSVIAHLHLHGDFIGAPTENFKKYNKEVSDLIGLANRIDLLLVGSNKVKQNANESA